MWFIRRKKNEEEVRRNYNFVLGKKAQDRDKVDVDISLSAANLKSNLASAVKFYSIFYTQLVINRLIIDNIFYASHIF